MQNQGKPTLVGGQPTGGTTASGNNNHDGDSGQFTSADATSSQLNDEQKEIEREILESGDQELIDIYNSYEDDEKPDFLAKFKELLEVEDETGGGQGKEGYYINPQRLKQLINFKPNESNIDFFFSISDATDQRGKVYTGNRNNMSNKQNGTPDEKQAVDNFIIGAGTFCFEFQNGLRQNDFSVLKNRYRVSQNEIDEAIGKIDSLIAKNPLPEDRTLLRFVNNDYMATIFGDILKANGITNFFTNQYDRPDVKASIEELYQALKGNIEGMVITDPAFMSVSFDRNWSHWVPDDVTDGTFDESRVRPICMRMAVKKDTPCYVTRNAPESEGILGRNIPTVIQDVAIENMEHTDRSGNKFNIKRLVIYYAVDN